LNVEAATPLVSAPWRFGFFAAVRWIETRARHLPRVGASTRRHEDAVLLGQSPFLSFAPATVAAAHPPDGSVPWRLSQRFFGVWGPSGPLPLHLTEQARERSRRHPPDDACTAFVDLFHHRCLSLLYRAWAEAEPAIGADREGDDPFGSRLAALGGLRPSDRDPASLRHAASLAAWPAAGTRSAEALGCLLSGQVGLPVRVTAPIVRWLPLPPDERCRPGVAGASGMLGQGALIGGRVRDAASTVRVEVGPVPRAEWQARPDLLATLRRRVRPLVDPCLLVDLRVRLAASDVPTARLRSRDVDAPDRSCLGRSAWLARRDPRDADDLRCEL